MIAFPGRYTLRSFLSMSAVESKKGKDSIRSDAKTGELKAGRVAIHSDVTVVPINGSIGAKGSKAFKRVAHGPGKSLTPRDENSGAVMHSNEDSEDLRLLRESRDANRGKKHFTIAQVRERHGL